MNDLERTVSRIGDAIVLLAMAYLAFHVVLAYGLHQTPDQFVAGLRATFGQ